MYYAGLNKCDLANGPGFRVSLFVSGCRNHCEGCFQPETWSFTYGKEFTRETLLELLTMLDKDNIEGLSILGGDPFEPEHRDCVLDICEHVRKYRPDRDIWVWTGYNFEDLKELPVMRYIDVLVDGRFDKDKKDLTLKWRGSSNQRVIDVAESLKSSEVVLLDA